MEDNNNLYVAVGKEIEERRSTLSWVLKKARGRNICVIHVHVPAQMIPLSDGSEAPLSSLRGTEIKELRERERQELLKILDDCTEMCASYQVPSIYVYIEKESITRGIVELISQLKIRILVMGAAANNQYSRRFAAPTSKKAKFMLHHAPDYCHIWFVCKDELIYTRGGVIRVKQPPSDSEETPLTLLDDLDNLVESAHRPPGSKGSTHVGQVFFERLYYKEYGLRKAMEENLAKGKEEIENMKRLWEAVSPELHKAMDYNSLLESQIEKSSVEIKELEEKIISAVDLLQKFKYKRDKYEMERDKALQENEELKKLVAQGPSSTQFSYSELQKATNFFDQTLLIGEGGYGSTYKGFMCYSEVAIKMLNSSSILGPREFDQQVAILSRLRHPKIVTLIGICPESWALIYEYLPGGSLKDRLICKNNASPLPWQARIQIATDICSALVFIHSSQPDYIIHGNLKPSNILLDYNLSCKLTDFGIFRIISDTETTSERGTRIYTTVKNCTMKYIDPDFLSTGELTPKSDVYSFGIILLRLLTGMNALGITDVKFALARGDLDSVLDPSAGEWPFVQAYFIARLGLSCCDLNPENRPDLESEVWRILQRTNGLESGSGSGSPIINPTSEQPPDHFKCPISMDVMEDPHMAADGFTYERKDIRKWLDSGSDTSPMTGSKLENLNLIPNHSLRSGIQEWQQQCRNV